MSQSKSPKDRMKDVSSPSNMTQYSMSCLTLLRDTSDFIYYVRACLSPFLCAYLNNSAVDQECPPIGLLEAVWSLTLLSGSALSLFGEKVSSSSEDNLKITRRYDCRMEWTGR
jgi:hypothetical protein